MPVIREGGSAFRSEVRSEGVKHSSEGHVRDRTEHSVEGTRAVLSAVRRSRLIPEQTLKEQFKVIPSLPGEGDGPDPSLLFHLPLIFGYIHAVISFSDHAVMDDAFESIV